MTLSIERRAALWGDRVAIREGDEAITYDELARHTRETAGRLATLGVGPGDRVAVVSRNRPEVLTLLFAVRRLGAILAPLSHRLTPATVEEPFGQVDPDVVIHEAAERDLVRGMPTDETYSFAELAHVEPWDHETVETGPETTLLLLPTERGVACVPARAVEWNCITEAAAWGLGRTDAAPILLPLSTADGLLRLALPLLYVGGTVVLDRAFDPGDVLVALAAGATCCFGYGKEFRELAECEEFAEADLSSLAVAVCGDELDPAVRDAFRGHGVRVARSVGTTVAGPNLLYGPPNLVEEKPDSLGRTFPDATVRLVDDGGTRVEDGSAGWLEATGPLTATGHLHGETFGEWVSVGMRARLDTDGDYRPE